MRVQPLSILCLIARISSRKMSISNVLNLINEIRTDCNGVRHEWRNVFLSKPAAINDLAISYRITLLERRFSVIFITAPSRRAEISKA